MANLGTIADVILRQNQGQPLVLNPQSTANAQFQVNGGTAVLTIPNPMASIDAVEFFPNRAANGVAFVLRAAGTFQLGGNIQYQINVNLGTATASQLASTGLLRSGLTAATGANENWLLEALCQWDSISTNLRGIYYGWSGANSVAQTSVFGGTVTTVSTLAALQFNVSVQIIQPNPNNIITLNDFSADLV